MEKTRLFITESSNGVFTRMDVTDSNFVIKTDDCNWHREFKISKLLESTEIKPITEVDCVKCGVTQCGHRMAEQKPTIFHADATSRPKKPSKAPLVMLGIIAILESIILMLVLL